MGKKTNWPTELKTEIVLTLLRGEATAAELARQHNINESTLSRWREQFLRAGQSALNGQAADSEKSQLKNDLERLKKLLGEKVIELDIVKKAQGL
jgi:transposase